MLVFQSLMNLQSPKPLPYSCACKEMFFFEFKIVAEKNPKLFPVQKSLSWQSLFGHFNLKMALADSSIHKSLTRSTFQLLFSTI